MEKFLNFLIQSKKALENLNAYSNIHIILGNESCDLDSTISALSLAYLKYSQQTTNTLILPILNVASRYFPLRTEICYLLNQCNIPISCLIFKDDINYDNLKRARKLQTSLVDHHVLAQQDQTLSMTVTEIYDHRPINTQEICQHTSKTIELVGSCTTLIARTIINEKSDILFTELANLLYSTIIYDTIGLDRSCGKTTDEDLRIAAYLENILKKSEQTRKELFQTLWRIHNDISSLKIEDLLYRDLKIVQNIPIPGLPLLVENYLKHQNITNILENFSKDLHCDLIVLIGIDAGDGGVKRDIGIYYEDESLKNKIVNQLTNDNNLKLIEIQTGLQHILCYRQGNIKLTRKYILPIINQTLQS